MFFRYTKVISPLLRPSFARPAKYFSINLPKHRHTMSLPELQWAQVAEKTGGPLVYKQIPVPKPGPDEVLVKIRYSGVCHTDLHALKGDWPLDTKMPLVGGHEGAGVVVAKGNLVHEFEIGDHAGLKWLNGSCLACEFCKSSDESLCPDALLSGYTVDGTFQQYAIGKAAHATKIPKNVPLDAVAPVLCAGVTVYKGLKEAGVKPGQTVAIVGAGGGLGSLALQYAKAMGIRVIAIDGGEEKKAMCESLGAEAYIDFTKSKDVVADVKAASPQGLGAHGVLLLAVAEKPFQQATEYVRPRGSVVAIGLPANAFLKAPVFSTVVRMINIKGSYVGNRLDAEEAVDFFARGLIKAPYKVVPLKELPHIFEMMEQGKIAGRYVLEIPE
ncbi:alcohol dehydrogenase, putative [Talaromyces stipitatus ATCC 10500]|uniref:alcohol dehydrogenase n=1 Tax=Talaromyces stipitatus (strain ATCC 10500 / CBS 375.48 / QM 6759 / NRRL 1006) TaxID=441959 RepID=B8MID8_TALSN|nr:alcohol dehydrogenase, putative [Talaromyces stipitatus ATCC 10500]EED14622.1 alcohol dehydrogenase, putative [Talaromyces stipitatus ATCC 10500]